MESKAPANGLQQITGIVAVLDNMPSQIDQRF
jgi:hypothetical protein